MIVAIWTLVSRTTGLLRVVVIGAVLGPTFLANTFLTTNSVPSLAYSIVAGPVLALVAVPAIVHTLLAHGAAASRLFVRRLSSLLVMAAGTTALLLLPVSAVLSWVLTLGVPDEARGRARVIALVLLIVVAPQVVLYTLAALGAAAQQAHQRFALAAAAPALENVGLMITVLLFAAVQPTGGDVGDVPLRAVLILGIGATASVGLHAVVQVFGAARAGLSLLPARGWRRDPEVRDVGARLGGSVVVAAAPAGSFFLLLAFAATIPGGALVFQMAYAVYALPTALGARAITTAVLPAMSVAVQAVDHSRFAAAWRQAFTYGAIAGLPALCGLVVFAEPIARTLAAGELHTLTLINWLAVCVAVLGVAQLASGIHEIGRQALYAHLDMRGPRVASLVSLGVTTAFGIVALSLPAGSPRLAALSTALLLADVAAAATVMARVRRAIHPESIADVRGLAIVVLAAAAMLPVLVAGRLVTMEDGDGFLVLTSMASTGFLALGVFGLIVRTLLRRRGPVS
ncbi:hypothetical protein OF117_14995 [Geodermatophilus sp. YIM 151500]|uniref:lipid II flippase MurJ n=1 Tax=Geodermatophilus sp. YIM 151500 TaxID=2984531 RepID=UPI0021E49417|nr:lipid II flippase MurJ [Geodermatophilus sp. YIM 151500]MCV2490667.1 hypothetical protein [Geodermatophilus sp. YIM 151500]